MTNDDVKLVSELRADQSKMEEDRRSFEPQWNEIIDLVIPRYQRFGTEKGRPGEKRTQKIFDATAGMALRHFAAAQDSMITPRTQRYQKLIASDEDLSEDDELKRYLEQVTNTLFRIRYRWESMFPTQMSEYYYGQSAFGSGGLMIEDTGNPRQPIRYRNIRLNDLWYAENAGGICDKAHIRWCLTARQAGQRWGRNALPPSIQSALERSPEQTFDFLHCIRPRRERDERKLDSRNMRFESVWLWNDDVIEHGGFRTFPAAIGRFYSTDGSAYGYSPAMDALPDVKMLNDMEHTNIKGAQKAVDPPLLLPEDGILEAFDLRSGALNYGGVDSQGNPTVRPLDMGKNVPLGIDYANQKRESVNLAFYVTLFQILVDNHQMTATEVLQRAQEKGILLAPPLSRVQSEMLGPTTERELDIAQSYGLLPQMPAVLMDRGGEVTIEYDSPLNRAMRAEDGTALLNWFNAMAPLAQIDPTVFQMIDTQKTGRGLGDVFAVPRDWFKTPEQIEGEQQATADAAQSAAVLEAAPIAAGAAKDLSSAAINMQNARV